MNNPKLITSAANPAVKMLRSLGVKKYREEEGLFLVEGMRHIGDALGQGWELAALAFSERGREDAREAIAACAAAGGQCLEVTDDLLQKITGRDNTQPVLGAFRQRFQALDDIKEGLWVGLETVRDPGNLGAIIRTADAAGAHGIILIGECCDPFQPETVRASMGSFARIPVARAAPAEFLRWRKGWKGRIVGTHVHARALDYRGAFYELPLLLLMGGESAGLSEDMASACDALVKIPMAGGAESLNLAVATGIMLYEIGRGRL